MLFKRQLVQGVTKHNESFLNGLVSLHLKKLIKLHLCQQKYYSSQNLVWFCRLSWNKKIWLITWNIIYHFFSFLFCLSSRKSKWKYEGDRWFSSCLGCLRTTEGLLYRVVPADQGFDDRHDYVGIFRWAITVKLKCLKKKDVSRMSFWNELL